MPSERRLISAGQHFKPSQSQSCLFPPLAALHWISPAAQYWSRASVSIASLLVQMRDWAGMNRSQISVQRAPTVGLLLLCDLPAPATAAEHARGTRSPGNPTQVESGPRNKDLSLSVILHAHSSLQPPPKRSSRKAQRQERVAWMLTFCKEPY